MTSGEIVINAKAVPRSEALAILRRRRTDGPPRRLDKDGARLRAAYKADPSYTVQMDLHYATPVLCAYCDAEAELQTSIDAGTWIVACRQHTQALMNSLKGAKEATR